MLCPYCLEDCIPTIKGNEYQCPKCKERLEREYVEKRHIPRTTIGLIGFSGHGKTAYITSLFYVLKDILMQKSFWRDFTLVALDKNTMAGVYDRVQFLKDGELPPPTPLNFPRPCIVKFSGLPFEDNTYREYFVTFYDIGGEVYGDEEHITDKAKIIAKSINVLFLISISDRKGNWQDRIYRLLNTYILGVRNKLKLDPKKYQNLIVVFTKADEILDKLSGELSNYLITGTYTCYPRLDGTLEEIDKKSRMIEQWLREQDAGGFVNLARQQFKSVHYTVASALGARPDGQRLHAEIQPDDPKRVLDPFILALNNHYPLPFRLKDWINKRAGIFLAVILAIIISIFLLMNFFGKSPPLPLKFHTSTVQHSKTNIHDTLQKPSLKGEVR